MSKSVNDLPIELRLKVAYLASAYCNSRNQDGWNAMDYSCEPEDLQTTWSDNPYGSIWRKIDRLYKAMNWNELCKIELEETFQKAFRLGFTSPNHSVSAEDVQSAVKSWRTNGWFRYEHERDERYNKAYKTMRIAALFFGGGFIL